MGRVIAFDPGAITGWATFRGPELLGAGIIRDVGEVHLGGATLVLIEKPLIYALDSKGDPNNLITLAIRAGELGGWAKTQGIPVRYVYPRTWKGTVPKAIGNKRTLAKLSDREKERLPEMAKSNAHNMLDAVGIGLWWLEKGNLRP